MLIISVLLCFLFPSDRLFRQRSRVNYWLWVIDLLTAASPSYSSLDQIKTQIS